MAINRLQVTLSGGTMGAGVATHYLVGTSTAQSAFVTFWQSCAALMSGYATLHVPNGGDTFDEATGALTGTWVGGTATNITGGGTGAYAGGVGACVGWNTGGIHYSRHVRGRTFIVPLASNQYDTDGTLANGAVTTLNSAAATLLTTLGTAGQIWCRPTALKPIGGAYSITSGLVKDHVSWLKSRR